MRRLVLYGLAGVINTAVTFAVYVVLVRYVDYRIALIGVYPLGILISYLLNGAMVFGARGRLLRFVIVYVLLLGLNIAMTSFLVEVVGWSAVLAQVPTIFLVYLIGFYLSRRFVFRVKSDST